MYRDACPDSRKYRFFDDVRLARARFRRRFDDRAALGRGDARRHAYHDFGFEEIPPAERFSDVVAQHRLRHAIIRDDAVLHRAIRNYFTRRAADHFLGVIADGEYFVVAHRYGHDRRLIEHDAPSRHKDEHRRGAEVYTEFGVKGKGHGECIVDVSSSLTNYSNHSRIPNGSGLRRYAHHVWPNPLYPAGWDASELLRCFLSRWGFFYFSS